MPDALLHAVHDASAHPTMAVAHLVAAVVCGWWPARGERALRALVLRALGLHRPTPGLAGVDGFVG